MQKKRRDFLRTAGLTVAGAGILIFFPFDVAFADKASVTLEAPEKAKAGSRITIVAQVTHNANNFLHYTSWLSIKVDGKEVSRWDYTWRKRPDGKNFSKQITITVNENTRITAEAYCNLHGSKGPATVHIAVEK